MLDNRKILYAVVAGTAFAATSAIPTVNADANRAETRASAPATGKATEANTTQHDNAAKHSGEKTQEGGNGMQAALNDAWLDGKLETSLLFMDELNSFAINTEVSGGVAHLTGTVGSEVEYDLAEEVAQSIDGIKSVENELQVKDKQAQSAEIGSQNAKDQSFRETVANAALTARIKSELLVNTNIAGLDIDIDTEKDTVTLSGSVKSQASSELAEQIAQNAAGNRDVDNKLLVEASS